ncbi:transcriptional regulator [Staphylococcus gallinarum]|uniref:Transcriptional regulator n=1 Tax=Staphylococcus gallinarum TaxID=1293 RepID=A0A380FMQ5_STAGA|nr:transcriptional regulator [Staphylococcus gallinarum]
MKKYVKKMHQHYGRKREQLIVALQQAFQDKVNIKDTEAGLHFMIDVKSPFTYEEIEQRAKEAKLELYTINRFIVKALEENNGVKTLIIGFSKIKIEQLDDAVRCLKKVLLG